MKRECNKRCKTLNSKDRISKLPDEIISHILSRLPTDEAAKTSVLSRTWQYQWRSIYNLEFDDHQRHRKLVSFINFVYRILVTCNSRIRSFSLSLSCAKHYDRERDSRYLDPKYVETWISCALTRNVEILKISDRNLDRLDSPWCFRNWTSLTELELRINCTLWLPVDNVLPNLKRLLLAGGDCGGIKIKQEQISNDGRVILIFPVLEYLFLKCDWLDVNFVEIHAPELITFESYFLSKRKAYEIEIFGERLTTFSSRYGAINNFNLRGSPAVSYAELNHSRDNDSDDNDSEYDVRNDDDSGDEADNETDNDNEARAHKILNQLPNLKCLTLSGDLAMVLVPSHSGLVFPTFDRLRELHLVCLSYIKVVVELLQLLPQVELLNIDVTNWGDEETGKPWDPKIVSNLKKVELGDYRGHTLELDFLQFVLENAKKLEKMSVVVCSDAPAYVKTTIDFISKLLSKPSGCVIEVL